MEQENNKPTFAVILPVYNEENNIRECLDSIINQTFSDWVCYICNDCSQDRTLDICKEYAESDARFIIINSKYNKYDENGNLHLINKDMRGISKMLNLGIVASDSKYILRMDADDVMLPERMQLTYNWMEAHPECDIAGFPVIYKGKTYSLYSLTENKDGICSFTSMSYNVKPYHPTVCMRRDTVLKKTDILYQQPYDACEDAVLWFHAKAHGCNIMIADTDPVLHYNGGRGTQAQWDIFKRLTRAYNYSILKETEKNPQLSHYKEGRKITIVIGFKNENIEVEKTVLSLLMSDDNINIVLVDDCSDDGFDYKRVADTFGCFYIRNEKSLGCAGARCEGVKHVNTPYFILMDAHMRINLSQTHFSDRFVEELDAGDEKIVQCNTTIMSSNADEDSHFRSYTNEDCINQPHGAACIGAMYNHDHKGRDWAADWCYKYLDENKSGIRGTETQDTKVECISLMGAVYAMSVRWWNKIGGLEGLIAWGHDEPLLSIKTYLMGGKIITFPKYAIGHLYRSSPVYSGISTVTSYTNILFIQYIMSHAESEYETDDGLFETYKNMMQTGMTADMYTSVIENFNKNKDTYDKIKKYVWDNAVRTIADIRKLEDRLEK